MENEDLRWDENLRKEMRDIVAKGIAEARRQGAEEMRGRAAKVAEEYEGPGTDADLYSQLGDSSQTMWDIASAIRALPADKEGG